MYRYVRFELISFGYYVVINYEWEVPVLIWCLYVELYLYTILL